MRFVLAALSLFALLKKPIARISYPILAVALPFLVYTLSPHDSAENSASARTSGVKCVKQNLSKGQF